MTCNDCGKDIADCDRNGCREYEHIPLKIVAALETHPKGTDERIRELEAELAECRSSRQRDKHGVGNGKT